MPALNSSTAEDAAVNVCEDVVGEGEVERTTLIERLKLFGSEVNL
ncbi:hypothetical protein [Nostoc sp.]